MSTFLVSNFPVSKSGPKNNQNLESIIGNDKKALSLSYQIKTGCGNEDTYFNYLQAIKDKGDLSVVTEYLNPFAKRHSQITNDTCYGEIAFTIWNFICFLINKTSTMLVSTQEDLLKIQPILSDLNALAEDLKFLSTKLHNHLLFSKGFTNFVESYVNFMNAQQLFQIAIFKKIDSGILKSGGTLINQLQCCLKYLDGLGNGIDEYFKPEIRALIQYFNAYLYYTASLAQEKALSYGNAISSLRAASRILNPEDASKSKWFHGSKSDDRITLNVKNAKDSLSNKIESMLKKNESANRTIYSQVIPDDPPALPAAYPLKLFNSTPMLLFFCTVEVPGPPQDRYKKTSPTQAQPKTNQSPNLSPHSSGQLQSSQPTNQPPQFNQTTNQPPQLSKTTNQPPQFTQATNQPPQFTQPINQPPQFTQQINQPPQFTQTTNQPPQFTQPINQPPQFTQPINQPPQFTQPINQHQQFSQSSYQNSQFSPSASQNLQFSQQLNQYPQHSNPQFYQTNNQPQFIQQTNQQIPLSNQHYQHHYPSMPINPQFSPYNSSDMFNIQNNPNVSQPYGQYSHYQNPNQYTYAPQSLPDSNYNINQPLDLSNSISQKSQSGGLPFYNQPPTCNNIPNYGSSPNFSTNQQPPTFNFDQQQDPDQDFGAPPVFVPTAPPPSTDKNEDHKKSSQKPQQKPNNGPPVFTNQQGSNNGPPIFTNQQGSSNGPPAFNNQQGSSNGPPVFTNQQGSNNGPPIFTNQQGSNNGPPVFTNQKGSSNGPPVFTDQKGSNNGPPVFTHQNSQQGSNGGPPIFTDHNSQKKPSSHSPPSFTPQQGSSGGPPVFTNQKSGSSPVFTPTDQPPSPISPPGSNDTNITQPPNSNASGNQPPSFSQPSLSGPPVYTPFDQLSDEQIFPQMAKLKDLKQDVAMKIVDLSGTADDEIMNMVNMYAQQLSEAAVSDGEIDKLIQQYKQPGHSGIKSEIIEKAINGAIGFYTSINEQLQKIKQHT